MYSVVLSTKQSIDKIWNKRLTALLGSSAQSNGFVPTTVALWDHRRKQTLKEWPTQNPCCDWRHLWRRWVRYFFAFVAAWVVRSAHPPIDRSIDRSIRPSLRASIRRLTHLGSTIKHHIDAHTRVRADQEQAKKEINKEWNYSWLGLGVLKLKKLQIENKKASANDNVINYLKLTLKLIATRWMVFCSEWSAIIAFFRCKLDGEIDRLFLEYSKISIQVRTNHRFSFRLP